MKKLSIFLILAVLTLVASAQKSNWAFFAGYNNALGSFAKSDVKNYDWVFISSSSINGGAGYGFNLGFSYRLPLGGTDQHNLVFSADFMWTASAYAIRNANNVAMFELRDNFDKVRITSPNFINVPVLMGYHYETAVNSKVNIYAEAQFGASFRHITDRSAEFLGGTEPLVIGNNTLYEYAYTDRFNKSLSYAFRITAGIVIIEHWIVDLAYLYTGKLSIDGYEDYRYSTNADASNPVSGSATFLGGQTTPMFVTVRFGYRL